MVKSQYELDTNPKLLKREQAMARYGFSWNTLVKAASEAGAFVRFGRSVRLNRDRLDAYFDGLSDSGWSA